MVHEGEEAGLVARAKRDKAGFDKSSGPVAELAAVKEADRAVKAATKARKSSSASKKGPSHPVRAAKSAARQTAGKAPRRR
jgi:ribonuclease R